MRKRFYNLRIIETQVNNCTEMRKNDEFGPSGKVKKKRDKERILQRFFASIVVVVVVSLVVVVVAMNQRMNSK